MLFVGTVVLVWLGDRDAQLLPTNFEFGHDLRTLLGGHGPPVRTRSTGSTDPNRADSGCPRVSVEAHGEALHMSAIKKASRCL